MHSIRTVLVLLGNCAVYNGYYNEKFLIKFIVDFNKLVLQVGKVCADILDCVTWKIKGVHI
jgi:hypothetical protein